MTKKKEFYSSCSYFLNTLSWSNHRFTGICKNSRKVPFALHPVSPNDYVLHSYSTI